MKKASNLSTMRDYLWWDGPGLHSSPHAVYAFDKIVFGTDEEPDHLDFGTLQRVVGTDNVSISQEEFERLGQEEQLTYTMEALRKANDPAILNAISDESTVWYLPSTSVTRTP